MTIALLVVFVIVLAVAVVATVGRARFDAQIGREAAELLARPSPRITPEQIASRYDLLPEPIRRHLDYALANNGHTVKNIRMRHEGMFRTGPHGRWAPIAGQEYFTAAEPGFVWSATISPWPLTWIEARDKIIASHASMVVKLWSTLKLLDMSGPELDQGARLRWLGEAVWFPMAFAADCIRWDTINLDSARATLVADGLPVSAVFQVDDQGKIVRLTAQRYCEHHGRFVLRPWKADCSDYREFGGVRIPARVEITWQMPEGDFTYAKFTVTRVDHNVSLPA